MTHETPLATLIRLNATKPLTWPAIKAIAEHERAHSVFATYRSRTRNSRPICSLRSARYQASHDGEVICIARLADMKRASFHGREAAILITAFAALGDKPDYGFDCICAECFQD